jgi:DNA polymerase-3 subunit alpha
MQICRTLAGFSFGRADIVRRAMSKKKSGEMEKEHDAFIYGEKDAEGNTVCTGALAAGLSLKDAEEIFADMADFAKYAFNKSHATAYAYLSYRTAYLKAHYPCEYFASLISSVSDNITKSASYIEEARKMHIEVLGPDINESRKTYHVTRGENGKKSVRFGLLGIKNVGDAFLSRVISEREENGLFVSFVDFAKRMSAYELNKRQVEALIGSGAFDTLGIARSALHAEYENIIDIYLRRAREQNADQMDLFTLGNISVKETFGDADKYAFPDIPDYSVKEKLRQEKEFTGMYFSGHPLDDYAEAMEDILPMPIGAILASFDDETEDTEKEEGLISFADKQRVKLCGIINSKTVKSTKNGASMAFVTIEDKTGEIELVIFPKIFAEASHILMKDTAICLRGEISAEEGKLLVIPLNMKDGLLLCRGKGNPEWNHSAPHGAGRLYSRSRAKEIFTVEEYKTEMEGIFSTCINASTLDEAPFVYKDYKEIMECIEPTVEILERLIPIFNFKANE